MRFDDIQAPFPLRAAEVALAGGHSIVFVGSFDSPADELADLVNEQGLQAYSRRPCPCGNRCEAHFGACTCSAKEMRDWAFWHPMPTADIYVEVQTPGPETQWGENHETVMERIRDGRWRSDPEGVGSPAGHLLDMAEHQLGLSDEQIAATIEVAKTIARLACDTTPIEAAYMAEAIQYLPRRST